MQNLGAINCACTHILEKGSFCVLIHLFAIICNNGEQELDEHPAHDASEIKNAETNSKNAELNVIAENVPIAESEQTTHSSQASRIVGRTSAHVKQQQQPTLQRARETERDGTKCSMRCSLCGQDKSPSSFSNAQRKKPARQYQILILRPQFF